MTTEEVAKKVVELTRKQAWYEALDTLYDDNVVSVEALQHGRRLAGNSRQRRRARQSRLVGERDGSPHLRCQGAFRRSRSIRRAIRR